MFSTNYLPHIGGAELALKEITDRIKDIHFDLITSRLDQFSNFSKSLPEKEQIGNLTVYRVGTVSTLMEFLLPKNFFPISALLKARELTNKFGSYDSVFALQASQGAGGAWLYKFFHRKPSFVLNIQEGKELKEQGFLFNLFRSLIIKKADLVIVISNI